MLGIPATVVEPRLSLFFSYSFSFSRLTLRRVKFGRLTSSASRLGAWVNFALSLSVSFSFSFSYSLSFSFSISSGYDDDSDNDDDDVR